ncbi:polyprenyl synthetase family protein [Agilicoccus flavus]|uniref:polyprenyl synthetase family protein n=1 Tax=Agilicoccus flavus TaxID=2775968 RepID=UPI001CF68B81|nr:polyprenyl synthetase family protein [Agilicoccus flavus]
MTVAWHIDLLRRRVQEEIDRELAHQGDVLAELGPDVRPLVDAVASLMTGGKRLRAAFTHVGYLAAGGRDEASAIRAATAMEFFQAAALLHDDVMDASDVRRGAPTAHVALADLHRRRAFTGDAQRFGEAGAILAGDLCLVWSEEVFATCGLPPAELARARRCFDDMRSQLMAGQFLDVLDAARGWSGLDAAGRIEAARRVIRYKSARYSVQQPLLIGADAGGVDAHDRAALARFGLDLGEAFQLRDDILGVFGDPSTTGKPAGDDLREGKRTVLVALTLGLADAAGAADLEAGLGADLSSADVDRLRAIIVDSGGLAALEDMIAERTRGAREALESTTRLRDGGVDALLELADLSTVRAA